MHYVKQFKINGVDTRQAACIELNGKPNAATEGYVGVLGVDVTSPSHDVYKCVAVNGAIYTWELLSSGMSILSAKITGEGTPTKSFPYEDLRIPSWYIIKVGDLILDSGGYLYQVNTLGSQSCEASYCGVHFEATGDAGKGNSLVIKDGQLQLVSELGNVLSSVDYLLTDESTIHRDTNGDLSVIGVKTINNTLLKFFVGTREQYDALSEVEKANLFALITDDTSKEDIENAIKNIEDNYAKKSDLTDGTIAVTKIKTTEKPYGRKSTLEAGRMYIITATLDEEIHTFVLYTPDDLTLESDLVSTTSGGYYVRVWYFPAVPDAGWQLNFYRTSDGEMTVSQENVILRVI